VILAIFVPIIIFFITLTIAYYTGVTTHYEKVTELFGLKLSSPKFITSKTYNPFDLKQIWPVWLVFLIVVCIFEYKLFGDKKRKINN